jgi:predicted HicB family RNase H-like nuclease
MGKSNTVVTMLIRLPRDMKRQLEKEAKEQHRSLSAHVWAKLQSAMIRDKERRAQQ